MVFKNWYLINLLLKIINFYERGSYNVLNILLKYHSENKDGKFLRFKVEKKI